MQAQMLTRDSHLGREAFSSSSSCSSLLQVWHHGISGSSHGTHENSILGVGLLDDHRFPTVQTVMNVEPDHHTLFNPKESPTPTHTPTQ
ncbi:hypothetical protein OJAV_G00020250 [Oryzias javanicus]|uniref:Uncharacterized protein n=1 Tax=Oryzias javanicus TaxID=123683 RepID=A0A437DH27_ORYJA|nr:hypothetical protein OJAV_G00020250 [Oryzias javanicus]